MILPKLVSYHMWASISFVISENLTSLLSGLVKLLICVFYGHFAAQAESSGVQTEAVVSSSTQEKNQKINEHLDELGQDMQDKLAKKQK